MKKKIKKKPKKIVSSTEITMNVWQPACRPGPNVQAGWREMQRVWSLEGHRQELPVFLVQEWGSAPQRIPAAGWMVPCCGLSGGIRAGLGWQRGLCFPSPTLCPLMGITPGMGIGALATLL